MNEEYLSILSFLRDYSGKQYRMQEKCTSEAERQLMNKGSNAGKAARASFTKLVDIIENEYGLHHDKVTQWQNSGTFVSYFWCQMKRPEYNDSQISLSLFAEKAGSAYRIRISVELAIEKASVTDKNRYKRLLDRPLTNNLVYVSGGNNETEFKILSEHDNDAVRKMNLKKVQVSSIIDDSQIGSINLENLIVSATGELAPYYDYLFEDEASDSAAGEWWPSLSDYNPGISKAQWLELLNREGILTNNAFVALACMYDCGGTASCRKLEMEYGRTSDFYRAALGVQLASKVKERLSLPYCLGKDGKNQVWPILFQGRKALPDEAGSFIWRMRQELFDALTEFGISRYLEKYKKVSENAVAEINTRDALAEIKSYIAARGFDYTDGLIENFYLSLKSKPFVILAGTSGTGKTRLVKLFAEAIGAVYKLVPVRPDWSDGSDLFGYTDLNGKFVPGPVCAAFDSAIENPERPVFLCLDEMNLARVEYYLSDFLSVIESREKSGGHITTEAIAQYENGIPDNLFIIGTVNMDETTFPFSKKVLDRANTIEFNYVNLIPKAYNGGAATAQELPVSFLRTEYLVLANDCVGNDAFVDRVCTELQALNEKLAIANAHVGYRVRDEIVFYMLNNEKAGNLLTYEEAMDNEIMQKILPRIQGSSASVKTLLSELFQFCMGKSSGIEEDTKNAGEQMKNQATEAVYPQSAKKIGYMMKRFEDDGFTSYWL